MQFSLHFTLFILHLQLRVLILKKKGVNSHCDCEKPLPELL